MKKILSSILICTLVVSAGSALAADQIQTKPVFNLLSTAVNATTTSGVTDTGLNTRKTVIINGMKSASTFGNYSGLMTVRCAPTATGPWVTAKDKNGTAVTATTNTVFHLDDLCRFVSVTYTRGAQKGTKAISTWLLFGR